MAESLKSDALTQEVSFGKIVINAKARLRQFDNGDAKAYQAYERGDDTKKFIALISGVECMPRWSAVNTYDALSDTSFMHMVGHGIVNWPIGNVQKYVFMYRGGVSEPLIPDGGRADVHWRHPEVVEYLIQPIARVLREMHEKNFNHGSLRPSNIFYSAPDKKGQVILGDCLSVQSGSTPPELFLPINRACCHPMGRGNGSVSDDIYAFGVTLALFLRKDNDILQISGEELLRLKIENGSFNTIIGKERLPSIFLEVLRGVLHDDPELRWSLDELFSWLDGTRMNPPPVSRRKKANRPYVFNGSKYLYADMFALDLWDNPTELAVHIEDGSICQWIGKSISDPLLLERYEKVVERLTALGGVSVNLDFLVSELRVAFNPVLPVRFKSHVFTYDGLGNLLAYYGIVGRDVSAFKDVLNLSVVDHALYNKRVPQSEVAMWHRLFEQCRSALRASHKIGYGVEKCAYLLSKNAPCMSPAFKGFFVNGHKSALAVYEKSSAKGGQVAFYMDQHAIAFFSVHDPNEMDRVIYDLDAKEKDRQVIGNLKFLSMMQVRAKKQPVPAIANVFLESLSDVYEGFKNKKLKDKIKKGVKSAAAAGDLVTMLALLEDEVVKKKDDNAFIIARREYMALQSEYDEYNKRLGNKKTYGVTNGHDAAAIVAWVISTAINVLVVFAFLSGYRIF